MKYTVEDNLSNFKFWSGGKDRADKCSVNELDSIEDFLQEIEPEDGWTDTAINDIFWFEFNTLAQHLGYDDEEDFDLKHDPNYVDDEELSEYADKWFIKFVQQNRQDYELLESIADQFGVGLDYKEWEMYENEDSVADYIIRCYEDNKFCLTEYLFDEDNSGNEYVSEKIPTTCQLRKLAMAEKGKMYRIIINVQYGEMQDECDKLYDGSGYRTIFTDANGEAVIDYLKDWDSDEWSKDDIRDEEPQWVNNGTDSIHQKDGYTLIYNSTLGGVYMLYREANEHEIQWYKEQSI
ncbi:hypothetical protein [Bacteroides uniformis]|mgnify:FL=1|nr:hypothetical protein [Bacteroides uniformis]